MADSRAEQIEQRLEWIEKNRARYRQVTQVMADPKEVRQLFLITIPNAIQELMNYDPSKHSSDMAVAACSKAQLRFLTLLGDVEFIEIYEEKVEILENLESQAIKEEGDTTADGEEAIEADLSLPG